MVWNGELVTKVRYVQALPLNTLCLPRISYLLERGREGKCHRDTIYERRINMVIKEKESKGFLFWVSLRMFLVRWCILHMKLVTLL